MGLSSFTKAISANATSVTITGTFVLPYQVLGLTTDWLTDFLVTGKTGTQFVVTFGTPAPSTGGNLDYLVSGTLNGSPATSLDLCNNALLLVGDQMITSLTQDVPRAQLLNALYVPTMDQALRMHNWNFAQVRTTLAALTCGPAWEFTYQYELPTGACSPLCLMVLETDLDAQEPWRVEYGCSQNVAYRVLATDGCLPSILYIGRIDDVTMWDPLFTDAFTYELAFRIAYPLTRNANLSKILQEEKEARWAKAKSRDGQEGRALKTYRTTALTSVR